MWELDPPVPGAVIGRLFERGSYHLAAGAFRYRPGRGGRQPLTAQVLHTEAEGVSGVSSLGAGLDVRLAFEHGRSPGFVDSLRVLATGGLAVRPGAERGFAIPVMLMVLIAATALGHLIHYLAWQELAVAGAERDLLSARLAAEGGGDHSGLLAGGSTGRPGRGRQPHD